MNDKDLEKIFKALANRRRIAIIKYLKNRNGASVGSIAGAIKLSFKATSKHLNILATAGFLEKEQKGLLMFYTLSADQPGYLKHLLSVL